MQSKRNIILSLATAIFSLFLGTAGVYYMKDQFTGVSTWFDALYYTMVTYTTLGSNITPHTQEARLLVIVLVIIGVGCFATILTLIVVPFFEDKIRKVLIVLEHAESFAGHTIVCGYTPVTLQIALDYQRKGDNLLLVTEDSSSAALLEALQVNYLVGDTTIKEVMQRAGTLSAQEIIIGTGHDGANILLMMMLNDMFKLANKEPCRYVAIMTDAANEDKAKQVGAQQVIVPSKLAVAALNADPNNAVNT